MVIVLKSNISKQEVSNLVADIEISGLSAHVSEGLGITTIGLVGDTTKIDRKKWQANPLVEKVMIVQEPFKRTNRRFKTEDTIINVGDIKIGGNALTFIAGPCSVESEEQIVEIAREVKRLGATALRGGAFKPRTSPYTFQGLELEGLKLLKIAKEETGLPIVTEIMSTNMIDTFINDGVDIIQVGARNMQNFDLLKQLGKIKTPILLKRGLAATIEEWIMSAEYIMAGGNDNVILCERGIRTVENYTRNTLDISAVPVVKKLSHLPIIMDPSHAAGLNWMVDPLSKAAVAVGCDGLIIEVHNNPVCALCDGQQSITPKEFGVLIDKLRIIAPVVGRTI